MKCRRHSPVPYLEKLGGFAPEWVVLLRNRAVPEACFGVKIAILGGFAPEYLSGIVTQKLGGHAPVHAFSSKSKSFTLNFLYYRYSELYSRANN